MSLAGKLFCAVAKSHECCQYMYLCKGISSRPPYQFHQPFSRLAYFLTRNKGQVFKQHLKFFFSYNCEMGFQYNMATVDALQILL